MQSHSSLGLLLGPSGETVAGIEASDPITDEYACQLADAIAALRRYAQQQSFSLVTRNYATYRETFDRESTAFFATGGAVHGEPSELMFDLMASVVNWLMAFRLFLDHTETDLKRRFGRESLEVLRFSEATSAEYDTQFSYRLMYRMRNYAQHAGMPSHSMNFRGALVPGPDGSEYTQQTFSFCFDRDGLLRNFKGWGRQVKGELSQQAKTLEVDPHVTRAMEALNRIMGVVAEVEMPTLLTSARMVGDAIDRLDLSQGGQPAIFQFTLDGDVTRNVTIQTIPLRLLALVQSLIPE